MARKKITVIHDGDILKDGGDNPQSGDKFKIIFRTNCDCFVYVASADGSGWAQPLFPLGSAKGIPVKKDQEYVLRSSFVPLARLNTLSILELIESTQSNF